MPRTLKDIEMPEKVREELQAELTLWIEDWSNWTGEQLKKNPGDKWQTICDLNNNIVDWIRHFSNQPDPMLKNLKCHGGTISLFNTPCCECKEKREEK